MAKENIPVDGSGIAYRKLVQTAMSDLTMTWEAWLAEGMPQREPLTRGELERRISILKAALNLMQQ